MIVREQEVSDNCKVEIWLTIGFKRGKLSYQELAWPLGFVLRRYLLLKRNSDGAGLGFILAKAGFGDAYC